MINDEFINYLMKKHHELEHRIKGPFETEYGFGWEPTITYWLDNRRVHIYSEANSEYSSTLALEVVSIKSDSNYVWKGYAKDFKTLFRVLNDFLINKKDINEIKNINWFQDKGDHDKFIPHPPDKGNSANINELFPF